MFVQYVPRQVATMDFGDLVFGHDPGAEEAAELRPDDKFLDEEFDQVMSILKEQHHCFWVMSSRPKPQVLDKYLSDQLHCRLSDCLMDRGDNRDKLPFLEVTNHCTGLVVLEFLDADPSALRARSTEHEIMYAWSGGRRKSFSFKVVRRVSFQDFPNRDTFAVGLNTRDASRHDVSRLVDALAERFLKLRSNRPSGEEVGKVLETWIGDRQLCMGSSNPNALLTLPFPASVLVTSTSWEVVALPFRNRIHPANPYAAFFKDIYRWKDILQRCSLAGIAPDEVRHEEPQDGLGASLFARSPLEQLKCHLQRLLAFPLAPALDAEQQGGFEATTMSWVHFIDQMARAFSPEQFARSSWIKAAGRGSHWNATAGQKGRYDRPFMLACMEIVLGGSVKASDTDLESHGATHLKLHLRRSIAALPSSLSESLLPLIDECLQVPCRRLLESQRILLDSLLMRRQADKNEMRVHRGDRWYVMYDASNIGCRNVLMVRGHSLDGSKRAIAGTAAMLMKEIGSLPKEEFTLDKSDQMVQAKKDVESALEHQIWPPTIMAQRMCGGKKKAYNFAHTVRLLSNSWQLVKGQYKLTKSTTSDGGPERRIRRSKLNTKDVFPWWTSTSKQQVGADIGSGMELDAAGVNDEGEHVELNLQGAYGVRGSMHFVEKALHHALEALEDWKVQRKFLGSLCLCFNSPAWRQTYCIDAQLDAAMQRLFSSGPKVLDETGRSWKVFAYSLQWLCLRYDAIRNTWPYGDGDPQLVMDAEQPGSTVDTDDKKLGFHRNMIGCHIRKEYSRSYAFMLKSVSGLVGHMESWNTSCFCHCQPHVKERMGHGSCPLQGFRAVDLASGVFDEFLDEIATTAHTDVLARCAATLPAIERARILSEFGRVKSSLFTECAVRNLPYIRIPGRFLGVASHKTDTALFVLSDCLLQYHGLSAREKARSHPDMQCFLDPAGDGFPDVMKALRDGHFRDLDVDGPLQRHRQESQFIPSDETPAESIHAKANMSLKGAVRHYSEAYLSLTVRRQELFQMCNSEDDRNALVDYFNEMYTNALALERLQMTSHPRARRALQSNGLLESRFPHAATCGIIYNTAIETSYQTLPDMFGDDGSDGGGGGSSGGENDDDDQACNKGEQNKGNEDGSGDSSDSSSASEDKAGGAPGGKGSKVAKQIIRNNLAVHFKAQSSKVPIYAVKLPRPVLCEIFQSSAGLRESLEPHRALSASALQDIEAQVQEKPFLQMALAYYNKAVCATAGVGPEDLDTPVKQLEGFENQHPSLLEKGWVFFRLVNKNPAAVTRGDKDLIAQEMPCFDSTKIIVEVLAAVGADPEQHKTLLANEGKLFTVNAQVLFSRSLVAMQWEKQDLEAAFAESFCTCEVKREVIYNMCLLFGTMVNQWLNFNNDTTGTVKQSVDILDLGCVDAIAMAHLEKLQLVRCTRLSDATNPYSTWHLTQAGCDSWLSAFSVHSGCLLRHCRVSIDPLQMSVVDCLDTLLQARWNPTLTEHVEAKEKKQLNTKGAGPQEFFLHIDDVEKIKIKTQWYLRALVFLQKHKREKELPDLKHFQDVKYYKQYMGVEAKRAKQFSGMTAQLRVKRGKKDSKKVKKQQVTKRGVAQVHAKTFQWGEHRFTYRRQRKKGFIGAFSVTCPLNLCAHANHLNLQTQCKRSRSWRTDADEAAVVLSLKAFICAAPSKKSRLEHQLYKPTAEDLAHVATASPPGKTRITAPEAVSIIDAKKKSIAAGAKPKSKPQTKPLGQTCMSKGSKDGKVDKVDKDAESVSVASSCTLDSSTSSSGSDSDSSDS